MKQKYKMPYIPDKDLYAAVMFACKIVRENGYFNQACTRAANYYNVDVEDVQYYVRIAQGNGQRRANKRNPRKYHWYVVVYVPDNISDDDCGTMWSWDYSEQDYINKSKATIVKATSEWNAEKRVSGIPEDRICGYRFNNVRSIKEFNTQKEAQAYYEHVIQELERQKS